MTLLNLPNMNSDSNIRQVGTVRTLSDNYALVDLNCVNTCGECEACSLCHPSGVPEKFLRVLNTNNVAIGDRVTVLIPANIELKLSLCLYGAPLLGFIAGLMAGTYWHPEFLSFLPRELWQFLTGIITLILVTIICKIFIQNKISTPSLIKS